MPERNFKMFKGIVTQILKLKGQKWHEKVEESVKKLDEAYRNHHKTSHSDGLSDAEYEEKYRKHFESYKKKQYSKNKRICDTLWVW